jgi:hypothetical protein
MREIQEQSGDSCFDNIDLESSEGKISNVLVAEPR